MTRENENKSIKMERRGCDFFNGDPIAKFSDVGNYRVCAPCVVAPDGRKFFLEFTSSFHYRYRTTSKVNGRPLKHPVREQIGESECLHVSPEWKDEKGSRWGDCHIQNHYWNLHLPYTMENILRVTNEISEEQFDSIEFVR